MHTSPNYNPVWFQPFYTFLTRVCEINTLVKDQSLALFLQTVLNIIEKHHLYDVLTVSKSLNYWHTNKAKWLECYAT